MNIEEIKRRLMKMKALANAGVGGERANAEKLLEELAARHGINLDDLEGDDGKHTTTSAADVPRKKRKYTRHVKTAATSSATEESGVKVTRRKMADGTTIENRGNCQGGGTV